MWPEEPVDAHYATLRTKWIGTGTKPENYADFLDVKQGLHTATFEEEAKRDIVEWLKVMRLFLTEEMPDRLAQKARYEIAAAELRGRGSLDPALPLMEDFFGWVSPYRAPTELLDAAVLAVFARSANAHGHTSAAVATVISWVEKTNAAVNSAIANARHHGERCSLLEARAMLGSLPFDFDFSLEAQQTRFFDLWQGVVQEIKKTPYYTVTLLTFWSSSLQFLERTRGLNR